MVDERACCCPTADRGVWRLEAEAAGPRSAAASACRSAIFRLAGIYGPGRNAFVSLEEGRAKRIIKPGQVFNRIHVEDIARRWSPPCGRRPRIYNVADNEPAPPQDVIAYAAELMGVEPPPEVPFEEAELSAMARSFYGEVKRVSNGRIRQELGEASVSHLPRRVERVVGEWAMARTLIDVGVRGVGRLGTGAV